MWWWVAGALLLLHAVLAWLLRTPTILTGQDDAAYYLLAQGLRDLRYVDLWIAQEPVHIQYPPGYPALLTFLAVAGEPTDPASTTPSAGFTSAAPLPTAETTSISGCSHVNRSMARAFTP